VIALNGATVIERDPDWAFCQLHDPQTLLACVPGRQTDRAGRQPRIRSSIARDLVDRTINRMKLMLEGSPDDTCPAA